MVDAALASTLNSDLQKAADMKDSDAPLPRAWIEWIQTNLLNFNHWYSSKGVFTRWAVLCVIPALPVRERADEDDADELSTEKLTFENFAALAQIERESRIQSSLTLRGIGEVFAEVLKTTTPDNTPQATPKFHTTAGGCKCGTNSHWLFMPQGTWFHCASGTVESSLARPTTVIEGDGADGGGGGGESGIGNVGSGGGTDARDVLIAAVKRAPNEHNAEALACGLDVVALQEMLDGGGVVLELKSINVQATWCDLMLSDTKTLEVIRERLFTSGGDLVNGNWEQKM